MVRKLPPLHPGKMIKTNLEALELSIPKAAEILSISKQHLYRVAKGENPITPDLAYRIGKLFGNGSRKALPITLQRILKNYLVTW